jgi:CBS domain-containing protein
VFGSEARREQTLRTDQDNGLVYADPPEERRGAAGAYYARFAQDVIRALIAVGFTACPGNVMASNPRWCQPLSVWQGYFSTWIDHPSPRELLDASIYFDLRPVAGATDQAARLRAIIAAQAPKSHVFLGLLALEVVSRRLPLTLFGRVTTPRSGPYRGRLDVKAAGTFQLVGAGRVAALELGRPELNTIDRFQAAAEAGLYTAAEAQEIGDAYRHLMRLRLVHQLAQLAAGATPDNRIDVAALSRADALLLRDGLKTVDRVQAGLRARFSTDRLG